MKALTYLSAVGHSVNVFRAFKQYFAYFAVYVQIFAVNPFPLSMCDIFVFVFVILCPATKMTKCIWVSQVWGGHAPLSFGHLFHLQRGVCLHYLSLIDVWRLSLSLSVSPRSLEMARCCKALWSSYQCRSPFKSYAKKLPFNPPPPSNATISILLVLFCLMIPANQPILAKKN